MSNPIGADSIGLGPPYERIGGRRRGELEEMLSRRGLGSHTVAMYLGVLDRAELFCRTEALRLEDLTAGEVVKFAATLHQSRSVLAQARAALGHFWAAIGRRAYPRLQVTELVGRPSKDPLEGFAARELTHASGSAESWAETGYERDWLLLRLRERQLNMKTAHLYLRYLRHLVGWCEEHGTTIDTLSAGELESYCEERPKGRSTRSAIRSALIHYYALTQHPDGPVWAVRVPRKRRMISRALDDDAARALEQAAMVRDDKKGLAVILGLYLGLRRFEIAKLQWLDVRDGWLHIIGKGDVEATIPVHRVVLEYMDRHRNRSPFVFPGRFGGSAHPTTVWDWIREVSREAGLGEISPHVLRHTALAVGNDATGDLRSVQDFARHAEPTTTAGYTRASRQRLLAVSEAIGSSYRDGPPPVELAPPRGPVLPFEELIATLEGERAVAPWLQLARTVEERPAWRLAGRGDETGIVAFVLPEADLSVSPLTGFADGRPPHFIVTRRVGPDADDYVEWWFADVESLAALLPTFEEGGVPFPPTHSYVPEEEVGDDVSTTV